MMKCSLKPGHGCHIKSTCRPSAILPSLRPTRHIARATEQPSDSLVGVQGTPASPPAATPVIDAQELKSRQPKRKAESTDAIATFLTRRFGIAGGLAWLGFLAIGSLGEQVKTRMEVYNEESNTKDVVGAAEVVLPSGVSYQDLRVGGGSLPIKGYLAVVHYIGKANGEVFEDTKARGKPIVFFYKGRPFTGGLCAGVEEGMASMKAGGRRIIKVPASQGFGDAGTILRPTEHVKDKTGIIPGGATLEYDIELLRVSIPPS